MRPILWLHFLPVLIALGYHLPFYLQSGEAKIVAFFKYFLEGELSVPKMVSLIKVIHPTIYFIICVRIVLAYRKHLSNTASLIDTAFHRWLLVFCVVLLLPLVTVVFYVISSFQLFSPTTFFAGFFIFILVVQIATMVKPELFHTFPHQMLLPTSTEEQKQKYENSNLENVQKEKYLQKLQTYVTAQKPYLDNELTLAQLSEQVNIPAHYLSQVINEKLSCNFLDFINAYRIEMAKQKLIDPKMSQYTIMAVAYEAGFNARSTFYKAFKKYTGMTPSAYRKQFLKVSQ